MPVPRLLFLFLLLLPLLEIYLLVKVGGLIGGIPTVAWVVFTGVFGLLLLRHQGVSTANRVQQLMQQGQLPTMAMLEGMAVLLSAILLMIPGFFTDALGLLGLIPPVRRALLWLLLRRGLIHTPPVRRGGGQPPQRSGPTTIEGDYTREDD